jgi:hypothetical protein
MIQDILRDDQSDSTLMPMQGSSNSSKILGKMKSETLEC